MAVNIGIDFDRCLTEAHTLVPFILILETLLNKELAVPNISKGAKVILMKSKDTFYTKLADHEILTKGLIFRPAFLKLMPRLLHLRQQGKINKLFIYSNNTILELIDVCDYILGIILQKPPYSVNKDALIQEGSILHTLTPRIHLDNVCRNAEVLQGDFKEKTFNGIRSCLNEHISESSLWFIDDTLHHTSLVTELKERYVHVEQYTVKMTNKRLAELFIESFSVDAFTPGNSSSDIVLKIMNRVLRGFHPTGKDSRSELVEKLLRALNTFSPTGAGRKIPRWTEDHVLSDLLKLEKALQPILLDSPIPSPQRYLPTAGGKSFKLTKANSRFKRNRILRTRRKNRR